jgi:hypothetical protein
MVIAVQEDGKLLYTAELPSPAIGLSMTALMGPYNVFGRLQSRSVCIVYLVVQESRIVSNGVMYQRLNHKLIFRQKRRLC